MCFLLISDEESYLQKSFSQFNEENREFPKS